MIIRLGVVGWAAKGTRLLGRQGGRRGDYKRSHRSNLVGMGVLPFVSKRIIDRR